MLEKIAKRRTAKVIGDCVNPADIPVQSPNVLKNMLEVAGNAPFHYACDRIHQSQLNSPVPWRAYTLDAENCRSLMRKLIELGDVTKVPAFLASASYLIQVTWLPDKQAEEESAPQQLNDSQFAGTLRNMEHIAAASAFIQSLILVAEEAGYKTYWSSGGILRKPEVFELMDVPITQILLGSIFLFPAKPDAVETKNGALAEKRGAISDWSRSVEI